MTKFFLDSNILIYLVGADPEKAAIAERLLRQEHTISVQVLNEFVRVARNKFKIEWSIVDDVLGSAAEFCVVVPLTLECQVRAVEICRNHFISIYDANIIAAAELSGCDVLYTEDLNHGQMIGRVRIQNPFLVE